MHNLRNKISRRPRIAVAGVSLGLAVAVCPLVAPQAQRAKESGVSVTGVSARASGSDAVVSIAADGPLTRAQTWQDGEGFHVVVYKGQGNFRGLPRGVKVRRVGESLELVVPVKSGGSVYVQPRFNNLDLVVRGGLHAGGGGGATDEGRENQQAQQAARAAERQQQQQQREASAKSRAAAAGEAASAGQPKESVVAVRNEKTKTNLTPSLPPPAALKFSTPNVGQPAATDQASKGAPASPVVAAPTGDAVSQQTQVVAPPPAPPAQDASPASMQVQMAGTGDGSSLKRMLVVLSVCFSTGLAAFMFIFLRSRRKTANAGVQEAESRETKETPVAAAEFEGETPGADKRKGERRKEARRTE
ncbi:MAG TPA: hypothetical protein VF634_12435, partial [Pyrinomonadaceae bacterium]